MRSRRSLRRSSTSTAQDVRATATAQVRTANAVECMKPWAIADKWHENWEAGAPNNCPWTPRRDFEKYQQSGNMCPILVTTPDVYIPPTATNPGTGFTPFDADGKPTADYGLQMTLKIGAPRTAFRQDGSRPRRQRKPRQRFGSSVYRDNIENCNANIYQIGDTT